MGVSPSGKAAVSNTAIRGSIPLMPTNLESRYMIKLDLHGVKHEDAPNEIKRFLEDNWDCGQMVEIITGHSSLMKSIVTQVVYVEYKLYMETIGSTIKVML